MTEPAAPAEPLPLAVDPAPPKPLDEPRSRARRALALTLRGLGVLVVVLLGLPLYMIFQSEPPRFDPQRADGISFTPLEQLVPGPGLPEDLSVQPANNNCDVVRFGDRWFLGFRTAPHHFASDLTRTVVLSSTDRQSWKTEQVFAYDDGDMREPRFLVHQSKLFFYFFRAGSDPFGFEPKHIHVSERREDGTWTQAKPIYEPGYVVWRVRSHGGRAYMSVYDGAKMYTAGDPDGEVRLLVSDDGLDWKPISAQPQCTAKGASEAEFHFESDGRLVVAIRLEPWGSLVGTAPADDLGDWTTTYSPYKLDSPLMLKQGARFFLIARRNVAGQSRRGAGFLPDPVKRAWSFARYSLTRKRTALYEIDPEKGEAVPLFDFPSCGDTAFAGAARIDERRFWVVNYSSPIDGTDWSWLAGQLQPTHLYATELTFGN